MPNEKARIIPRTEACAYTPSWQEELQASISDPKALFQALDLPLESLPAAWQAHELFRVRVTPSFLGRMARGDINDPLLKQVLPSPRELHNPKGFTDDPLAESHYNPTKGLVHKYKSRVLLITTGQCAINCRYCFRRTFDYSANNPSRLEWQQALEYICNDENINEVILSGGDPLALNDRHLAWLVNHIGEIDHVRRIRIHTRLPIALPSRITPEFIQALSHKRLNTIVVVHCNHPQELDNTTRQHLIKLADAGFTLLNQSVLLAEINDNTDTLVALSEALFTARTLPYYLHLMDPVSGSAHFDVPQYRASALYSEMQCRLPGFLVPKLVREVPGEMHKVLLA